MPRMTNTYMMSGKLAPGEIIASVKKGLYAVNFGGGQVDITSGKFVFSAAEAYLIEDGKLGPAVKGATLIGNGPDVLTKVSMVGKTCSSTRASAPAARKARACRWASASRP
jgi:Predicted Zn-dependent proteases and their inactivated homologs